jgi:hypothetical protein
MNLKIRTLSKPRTVAVVHPHLGSCGVARPYDALGLDRFGNGFDPPALTF